MVPKALKVIGIGCASSCRGRGAYHAHGCLRLKHDPGFKALGDHVYKGRRAQKIAELNNLVLINEFPNEHICDDEWGDLDDKEEFQSRSTGHSKRETISKAKSIRVVTLTIRYGAGIHCFFP